MSPSSHRLKFSINWPLILLTIQSILSGCSTLPPAPNINNEAPYLEAQTLMERGKYKSSLPYLQKLAEIEPDKASIAINLVIALRETGQTESAFEHIRAVIAQHPQQAQAYNQLGIIERQRGHFEASRDAYQQAIALDNNYALAHRNLGILYEIYLQQPQQALAHYQLYQTLSSDDAKTINNWIIDLKRRTGFN